MAEATFPIYRVPEKFSKQVPRGINYVCEHLYSKLESGAILQHEGIASYAEHDLGSEGLDLAAEPGLDTALCPESTKLYEEGAVPRVVN